MDSDPSVLKERRLSQRCHVVGDHGIVSARVRPGHEAVVLNASASGVLIETMQRLLPGGRVELLLCGEDTARVTRWGRVLRSSVSRVAAAGVCYRGAIALDQPLRWSQGSA